MAFTEPEADRLDSLRATIAAEYPHLEVLTAVDIAGRGKCLIVEGPATEALVNSVEELRKYFDRRDVVSRPTPAPVAAQIIDAREAGQRWLF